MGNSTFELCAATSLDTFLGTIPDKGAFIPLPALHELPEGLPIFLDTNVLLGYYQMTLNARKALADWLLQQKGYLSNQVQREFKRHAQKLQRIHRRHLKEPIHPKHLAEAIEALQHYLQQQARLLRDYPSWQRELEAVLTEAKALEQYNSTYSQRFLKQAHGLLRQANHVFPISTLIALPTLQKQEYKHLKGAFDQAAALAIQENNKGFDDAVAAYQYRYPHYVFPGLGDVLNKRQNPYGDYLIYHELLKWAAHDSGSSPILFLTDDSTKGDWLDARGQPYPHYQQHFLEQTGRVLHIAAARPLFEQWLKVDTSPLLTARAVQEDVERGVWYKNAGAIAQLISTKSVKTLLRRLFPDREQGGAVEDWREVMEYLKEDSPYNSIFELEGQLLRYYPNLIRQILQNQQVYSQFEVLKKSIEMPF